MFISLNNKQGDFLMCPLSSASLSLSSVCVRVCVAHPRIWCPKATSSGLCDLGLNQRLREKCQNNTHTRFQTTWPMDKSPPVAKIPQKCPKIIFSINQWIVLSVQCQRIVENDHSNFPQPRLTSSNVSYCVSNSLKPKDTPLTIMYDNESIKSSHYRSWSQHFFA